VTEQLKCLKYFQKGELSKRGKISTKYFSKEGK
jgi:hypothetical protein